MEETTPSESLPPRLRRLIEHVAERMDAGSGRWRLEFDFEDGHLRRYMRHEGPSGADDLDRFEEVVS